MKWSFRGLEFYQVFIHLLSISTPGKIRFLFRIVVGPSTIHILKKQNKTLSLIRLNRSRRIIPLFPTLLYNTCTILPTLWSGAYPS